MFNEYNLEWIVPLKGGEPVLKDDILCPICKEGLTFCGYEERKDIMDIDDYQGDLIGGNYRGYEGSNTIACFHCPDCHSSFRINVDVIKLKKINYGREKNTHL